MISMWGCPFYLGAFVCLFVGVILGMRAIFVIRQSRGRLRGYGAAITSIVLSVAALLGITAMTFMGTRIIHHQGGSTSSLRQRGATASGVTGAHLFLVTLARDAGRGDPDRNPGADEVMPIFQDPDTVGEAIKSATGWSAWHQGKMDTLAAMQAEYFVKPARVRLGDGTFDIPPNTVAFFVFDRDPDTHSVGAGLPLGWKIIEVAGRGLERRSLIVSGTQVLSAANKSDFRFDR